MINENPPTYSESIENDNNITIPEVITNISEEKMILSYNLASTIKFITLIEIVFILLNTIYYPPAIFLILFPLVCYYSVSIYNRFLSLVYVFYHFTLIFFRIYAYSYMKIPGLEKMFLIFTIIVSLLIIQITLKFFRITGELNEDELQYLKSGFLPVITRYIWY